MKMSRRWNIVDLFDYCFQAKNDPITVVNNDNTESEVGSFRYLTFLWMEGGMNFNAIDPSKYVLSSNAFMQLIRSKFYSFQYLTSFHFNATTMQREEISTMDEAADELINTINVWKHERLPAFRKLLEALRAEYDPISNYDKESTITTYYEGKEKSQYTPEGTETDTFTQAGTETDTLSKAGTETHGFDKGIEDRKHYRTTYEGSTPYLTEEERLEAASGSGSVAYTDTDSLTFQNRQDTNQKSFQNRQDTNVHSFTNRKDSSERSFEDRQDRVVEHTSGNIGVTTSQQMILSQFGIADPDQIEYYCVADFIRTCCVGGDYDEYER